jgi:hypothetical protein
LPPYKPTFPSIKFSSPPRAPTHPPTPAQDAAKIKRNQEKADRAARAAFEAHQLQAKEALQVRGRGESRGAERDTQRVLFLHAYLK